MAAPSPFCPDAALLEEDDGKVTSKLGHVSVQSKPATMEINVGKTKHVHKPVVVSKTEEAEVVQLKLKHSCPTCGRTFPKEHGMKIHMARWCTGDPNERSRAGTLADKAVKTAKHKEVLKKMGGVTLDSNQVENVYHFEYLGSLMTPSGDSMADVERRMAIAQEKFNALSAIWKDASLGRGLRLRLIVSVALYGCDAWVLSDNILHKIRGFCACCMARIFDTVFHEQKGIDMQRMMMQRHWSWLGHVLQMSKERMVKCVFMYRAGLSPVLPHPLSHFMGVCHLPLHIAAEVARD